MRDAADLCRVPVPAVRRIRPRCDACFAISSPVMTADPLPGPRPKRSAVPPWLSVLLRIAITVALMAYALRNVDWREFLRLVVQADWRWWVTGLIVGLAVQVVAGVRWAALARPLGFDFPRRFFVWRFFEGMFFSLCLPSSIGGDVVKAFRVGDTTPRRLLAGCSVLADRLTGLSALGVLAGAALAAREYVARTARHARRRRDARGGGAGRIPARRFVSRPTDRAHSRAARGPGVRLATPAIPAASRPDRESRRLELRRADGGAAAVGLIARALGVDQPLSLWFSVVPLVALVMVLPISIGGFGVRENAMTLLLSEQGVPGEKAVAVGLLWGLSTIIMGLIGGLFFLADRSRRAS